YNLSFAHRIGAAVDAAALEHALTALVARHEGLRTTFPVVDEVPVQRLAEATRVSCPVVDLRPLAPRRRQAAVERLAAQAAAEPFDLAEGPLVRFRLVRLGELGDVFFLLIHHIVADAWSVEVIFRDLSVLYAEALGRPTDPLPDVGIQYVDYTLWQRRL